MSPALRLSILLNCGLVVLVALLAAGRRAPTAGLPPGQTSQATPAPSGQSAPQAAAMAGAEPKPFHWSQLESSDYPTYIANLRRIGCPQQTLRDIITADVASLYASKRQGLEAQLASLTDASFAGRSISRRTVEAELLRLPAEEAAFLLALLGPQARPAPSSPDAATEAAPALGARRQDPSASPVSLPLAFQDVDLAALNLDSGQRQAIEDLRQRFLQQIGGPNQDPADPAYRERWRQSQPENDTLLRGMIGLRAWQDFQLAARKGQ
jgi:hypothetical protein